MCGQNLTTSWRRRESERADDRWHWSGSKGHVENGDLPIGLPSSDKEPARVGEDPASVIDWADVDPRRCIP